MKQKTTVYRLSN